MSTHMTVVCDRREAEPWCEARFERVVDLPADVDSETNRLAAVINLAVADGWQAVNTRSPLTALTYCPEHHRADVHTPCCSAHGHALTCEQYRRTHFVEVRPCCATDATARLVDSPVEARALMGAIAEGDRFTMTMPRPSDTIYAPEAAVGIVGSTTTVRLPDGRILPAEVCDAYVVEGNLIATLQIAKTEDASALHDRSAEVSLGHVAHRRVSGGERASCPTCGRSIAVYVPRGGDGSTVLFRNHNGRGRVRCPGSKGEA